MLWYNWAQFWNQLTKCRMITMRNQLDNFFWLNTSRKDPWGLLLKVIRIRLCVYLAYVRGIATSRLLLLFMNDVVCLLNSMRVCFRNPLNRAANKIEQDFLTDWIWSLITLQHSIYQHHPTMHNAHLNLL